MRIQNRLFWITTQILDVPVGCDSKPSCSVSRPAALHAYFVDVAGDERLRFHRFGMSAAITERRALQRLAVEDRKGVGAGKQIELLPPVNPAILNKCRVIARSRFPYRPPLQIGREA